MGVCRSWNFSFLAWRGVCSFSDLCRSVAFAPKTLLVRIRRRLYRMHLCPIRDDSWGIHYYRAVARSSEDVVFKFRRSVPLKLEARVPAEGLEPTRSFDHWILSPARLPIPPRRRQASSSYEAGVIPQAFRRDREVANLVALRKFREERLRRGGPAREQRNVAISVAVRTTRVFGLASVTSGTSDSLMSSSGSMRADRS